MQHEIVLKLLFYTAVRVSELVHIEVGDVDLEACKTFINRGKGAKDRYILFPASFRLVLKSHLHAAPRKRYLFNTRRFETFTTHRIQQSTEHPPAQHLRCSDTQEPPVIGSREFCPVIARYHDDRGA